jgi:hypothetical protein
MLLSVVSATYFFLENILIFNFKHMFLWFKNENKSKIMIIDQVKCSSFDNCWFLSIFSFNNVIYNCYFARVGYILAKLPLLKIKPFHCEFKYKGNINSRKIKWKFKIKWNLVFRKNHNFIQQSKCSVHNKTGYLIPSLKMFLFMK